MSKGTNKDDENMTKRQPLPRAQEWKREDTIAMSNRGRRLLKEILEGNLDERATLKRIGLALEAFSNISILWMDTKEENDGNEG
jgi:hypothetical protein